MSSLVLVEWSLSMCQTILSWDPACGKQLEKIVLAPRNLTAAVSHLSINHRVNNSPTCLDFALTTIKQLATKAATYPAIVNGSLQSEPITYGVFDHNGLQHTASSYEEFRDKLTTACLTSPPTNSSVISMLGAVQTIINNAKASTNVVVFCSASAVMATQELAAAAPDVVRTLLPLGYDSGLFFVPIGRGTVEDAGSLDFFRRLVELNNNNGDVCWDSTSDSSDSQRFSIASLERTISKVSVLLYRPFTATLIFGDLSGRIQLIPSPASVRGGRNDLSEDFRVLGVLDKTGVDKLFPTRQFFILPSSNATPPEGTDVLQEPHLMPLVHASLRQMTGKIMLVNVAKNWFGYIEPTEDVRTKKKSGLVLYLFPEGVFLDPSKPIMTAGEDATSVDDSLPSYSPANAGYMAVWTTGEAVQGDALRLTRLAKRLPDKKDMFFKELNKIRLHALATCNLQFLQALAAMMAREIDTIKDPHGVQELENVLRQIRYSDSETNFTAPLLSLDGSVYPLEA